MSYHADASTSASSRLFGSASTWFGVLDTRCSSTAQIRKRHGVDGQSGPIRQFQVALSRPSTLRGSKCFVDRSRCSLGESGESGESGKAPCAMWGLLHGLTSTCITNMVSGLQSRTAAPTPEPPCSRRANIKTWRSPNTEETIYPSILPSHDS